MTKPKSGDSIESLLAEARGDLPSPAQIDSLARKLAPVIAPPAIPPTPAGGAEVAPATVGAGVAKGIATKVLLSTTAAVILAGGITASVIMTGDGEEGETSQPIALPQVDEVAPPTDLQVPSAELEPADSVLESSSEESSETKRRNRRRVATRTAAATDDEASAVEEESVREVSEGELLERARAALRSSPGRALAMTEEHRRRFARGALSQEREVIAITALVKLGRSDAARRRGSRFKAAYPGSIHQRRVDAILGRGGITARE